MGLLDQFFKKKKTVTEINDNTVDNNYDFEIETIILVLRNLDLLDKNEIEKKLDGLGFRYEKEILSKLFFRVSYGDYGFIEKYYPNFSLGYGDVKINDLVETLKSIVTDEVANGKKHNEIIDLLVNTGMNEVAKYEKVLVEFNHAIGELEESSTPDIQERVNELLNNYKDQELGYPFNISDRINSMVDELSNLEYGGYGEDELNIFKDACSKIVEEGKVRGEKDSTVLSRITSTLFQPRMDKYLYDLVMLNNKLQLIEATPDLSPEEKKHNVQMTITGFNELHGHVINVNDRLNEMINKLRNLEYGGYGELKIKQFNDKSVSIISSDIENGIDSKTTLSKIKAEFNMIMRQYKFEIDALVLRIAHLDELRISPQEKKYLEELYIQEFKDEMGHPIDVEARIKSLRDMLDNLEDGGYSEGKLVEFENKCHELTKLITSDDKAVLVMTDIDKLFMDMFDDYNEKLKDYREKAIRIREDNALTSEEKEKLLDENEFEFRVQTGDVLDFNNFIEEAVKELRELPSGGYGNTVISEFREDANRIVESDLPTNIKYERIKEKLELLKDRYISNLALFTDWKNQQLSTYEDEDSDGYARELDAKISHMVSLSPDELNDYYINSDKAMKDEFIKHNFLVAFKFLAKQEARELNDRSIYDKRLLELENGVNPYTEEQIKNAQSELEFDALFKDLKDDDRIWTSVDLINGTISKQISDLQDNDEDE